MNNIFKNFLSISILCAAVFLISCEGPAGMIGEDGTAKCAACHNEKTHFAAKQSQFMASAHSKGTYSTRGGQCAGCHSTEGFLARASFSSIDEIDGLGVPNQTAISCRTCHNVHMEYDSTDWNLTFEDQVTETLFGYKSPDHDSYAFKDMGNSNQCLQCHQARDRGNVPGIASTDSVQTNGHWGPHYGVQGNLLHAQAGVNVAGSKSYEKPTFGGHDDIGNACINCHMSNGDHTLAVNYESCVTCHKNGDAKDKNEALHNEIHDLLFALGAKLADNGVMSAQMEDDEIVGYSPKSMKVEADQAKAIYNYMAVYQDHSYGAHNPSYTRALLTNSLESLE